MFPNVSRNMPWQPWHQKISTNSSHNTWRNIIVPPTPFLLQQVIQSWNRHFLYLFCSSSATSQYPVLCSQSQPANGYKLQAGGTTLWFPWRCVRLLETEGPSSYPHNPHTPVLQTVCKQSEQSVSFFQQVHNLVLWLGPLYILPIYHYLSRDQWEKLVLAGLLP